MRIVIDHFNNYTQETFHYKEASTKFIGATWLPILKNYSEKCGIDVLLAADYLQKKAFSSADLIISEGRTSFTQRLLSTSAKPFLLFASESPNVDWKFYALLNQYTRGYTHALLFGGCKSFTNKNVNFVPFFWPNDSKILEMTTKLHANDRSKLLVMIAGNKKQHVLNASNVIKSTIKKAGLKMLTSLLPSLQTKDLYALRMKAMVRFAGRKGFDLYGRNWDDTSILNNAEKNAVKLLQPNAVVNKIETLSNYRFALCFENCIYPGYITEKIFDCFLSGTIPVYLGAPDVESYVPTDLFIDFRDFRTLDEVWTYLQALTDQEISQYRRRIWNYLHSPSFYKFTDLYFAETILSLATGEKISIPAEPAYLC